MALSHLERQQRYLQRAKRAGLVKLETIIKKDTRDAIGALAERLGKPKYVIVELAIRRLVQSYNEGRPI